LPDGWKLLSIETVVDCRHGPRAKPAHVPAPHTTAGARRMLAACADAGACAGCLHACSDAAHPRTCWTRWPPRTASTTRR
jgi:hypothetical protein